MPYFSVSFADQHTSDPISLTVFEDNAVSAGRMAWAILLAETPTALQRYHIKEVRPEPGIAPHGSALEHLPEKTRNDVFVRPQGLRDDLLTIADAEKAGWRVAFRAGFWHNAAEFSTDNLVVWSTGRDWRRIPVSDMDVPLNQRRIEVFPASRAGLRAALAL